MELRAVKFKTLASSSKQIAGQALAKLRQEPGANLDQSVSEAFSALMDSGGCAETEDGVVFVKAVRNLLTDVHAGVASAADGAFGSKDPGQRRWAQSVCRAGLDTALQTVSAGLPGGVADSLLEVTRSLVQEGKAQLLSDPQNAVSLGKAIQHVVRSVAIDPDDKAAEFSWQVLQSPGLMTNAALLAVTQECLNSALDGKAAQPFHQTMARAALDELTGAASAGEFLCMSTNYVVPLRDRLPENAPEPPKLYRAPGTPLERVARHLDFYEALLAH